MSVFAHQSSGNGAILDVGSSQRVVNDLRDAELRIALAKEGSSDQPYSSPDTYR
jgi:hypothetical protein